MLVKKVLYPLQPKQKEFANTFVKYRLYGGAKGGGKSYAMRSEAVRQCLSASNIRGLILRRTFPEVEENAIIPMLTELKAAGVLHKYNGQRHTITFTNGSTIRFASCRNKVAVANYQGIEYDFICIEELTHWREDEFKILKGCLRSVKRGVIPNFFASTNPGGIGHAWVRRIWVNRDFKKKEKPESYAFIKATVFDNQVLMKNQPEYLEELEDLPDAQRKAFRDGDWDVFEGQYFTEFRRDLHVTKPFIPKDGIAKRIIALDYGYKAPSAVYWMAKTNQGEVFVYRELYVKQHTYKQLALKIKAMTTEEEAREISYVIVDPAAISKKSESNATDLKAEFKKVGLNAKPGKNSRLPGWLTIREGLKTFVDPNTNRKHAGLKFTESCRNLISTLPEMIYDKLNVEDLDTTLEDHAVDGLRYGLMDLGFNYTGFTTVKDLNAQFGRDYEPKTRTKRPIKGSNVLNEEF